MKSLIKLIRIKWLNSIVRLVKEYSTIKYGQKSDVCVLTGGPEGAVSFQTSNTHGLIPIEDVGHIRKLVGENVLTICGLPQDHEYPPNVILLVSPSALFALKMKTTELVKEWPGNSMVGDITAITYTLY